MKRNKLKGCQGMNKIILTGRTTKNAELSYLPGVGTPKMAFSLAVERNYQKDKNNKKVDFINTPGGYFYKYPYLYVPTFSKNINFGHNTKSNRF